MIRINASLYYIAKLSKTMKWLKIKMPLSCQNCPVIDGRLTVECPIHVMLNALLLPSYLFIYINFLFHIIYLLNRTTETPPR